MAFHVLTAREVQAADDGDHADGGGLILRVHGARGLGVSVHLAQWMPA